MFVMGALLGLAVSPFAWELGRRSVTPIVLVYRPKPPLIVPVQVRALDVRDMLLGCVEASVECRSTRKVDLLSEDLDKTREVVCSCEEEP